MAFFKISPLELPHMFAGAFERLGYTNVICQVAFIFILQNEKLQKQSFY